MAAWFEHATELVHPLNVVQPCARCNSGHRS